MAGRFPSPTTTWHSTSYPAISPSRPELSAKGKTVLITGAGTGIGAETARSFAEAGAARIALLGRREQPLLDTKASILRQFPSVDIYVASVDVTNKQQVDSAFTAFLGDQKLDVVVNAAAIVGPLEGVKDVDSVAFLNAVQIHLAGALHVSQAFLRHAATDAVAIDVNSSAAHVNWVDGLVSYSVGKFAVYRLWDDVSVFNPNLRVFHVQPGVVDTDMNRAAGGGAKALGYEDHVSLPGSFNVWLASPEARFLKGKFLWSNWDVDELKARAKEIEESKQLEITLVGWPFAMGDFKPHWAPSG